MWNGIKLYKHKHWHLNTRSKPLPLSVLYTKESDKVSPKNKSQSKSCAQHYSVQRKDMFFYTYERSKKQFHMFSNVKYLYHNFKLF